MTGQGRVAIANEKVPESWLAAVETRGESSVAREQLSPENEGDEFLLMGLRLREGIDPRRFELLRGRPLDEEQIIDLEKHGMVARDADGRLNVTPEGFPVLDAVVADLAA